MLGRSVTFTSAPNVVAALSPTTVEYVFATGARSRTRSTDTTFPDLASFAVDVGPVTQPNLDLVAAQKPQLIVADATLQSGLRGKLEALGVNVLFLGAPTYRDAIAQLTLLESVLDKSVDSENAVGNLRSTLGTTQASLPAAQPKVLFLYGTPADFVAAKPASYAGSMLELVQGRNVIGEQPDAAAMPGFAKLTLAEIIAAKPDVIVAASTKANGAPTISSAITADSAWADVPAVKNKRVVEVDPVVSVQVPGPRGWIAMQALAAALYPQVFDQQ